MYKIDKNKKLKFITLIFLSLCYKFYAAENTPNLEELKKEAQSKEITLADIPQFKAYTSYIPKQILNILSKLRLNNLDVGWDSQAKAGIINAETDIAGNKGIIRLVLGYSNTIDKSNLSQSLKDNAKKFQNIKLTATEPMPAKVNVTQAGLTYFSEKGTQVIGGINKAKEIATTVQNKLFTSKKNTPEEKTKIEATQAAAETLEKEESNKNQTKTQLTETQTKLDQIKTEEKNKNNILSKLADMQLGIAIILPKGFSFEKLSSDLKFLDFVKSEEMALCLGTGFQDPIYGTIPPGFSLIAKINIEGPFNTINQFITKISQNKINIQNTDLELKGNINPNIAGSSFSLGLPGQFTLNLANNPFLKTDKLSLYTILLPTPEGSGSSGISFGISGGLTLDLDVVKQGLGKQNFKAFLGVDSSLSAILTGQMTGLLNLEPVGLPIKFGNITLQAGLNPENVETLGLSEIGMAGEFNFGPQDKQSKLTTAFDIKLSGQQTNILAYGELQPTGSRKAALTLTDILNLATSTYTSLGGHANKFTDQIPDLGIKDVKFYFSPANIYFADKVWPAGINVSAALDILGTTASVEFNVNKNGFDGTGYLSPINLGPLKITGAGKSKTCSLENGDECLNSCFKEPKTNKKDVKTPGTLNDPKAVKITLDAQSAPDALKERPDYSKEKGAIINLNFYPPSNIGLFLSTNISFDLGKIGQISSEACMDISTKGINVHFAEKLFNAFQTQFTLNAEDFKKPKDWYVCAKMEQTALDLLFKEVKNFADQAKAEIDKKIGIAQKAVDDAKQTFDNAMQTAQSALRKAEKTADDIKKQLDAAKKECGG